jgi:DNA polymerase-3 subunit alpha
LEEAYKAYFDRLDYEVDVIVGMGFPGYFLIVADFIKWAKDNDIPWVPAAAPARLGRRLGADDHRSRSDQARPAVRALPQSRARVDAGLRHRLLRNPARRSDPLRQQRYGADKVAQIITFGKLKARAVLKDTGRVLQMSYGHVDRLAKLIPNHPTEPWDLERALNGVSELAAEYKNDAQVRRLFDLARKLEGLPRHSSTHARASSSGIGRSTSSSRSTAIRARTCPSPSST